MASNLTPAGAVMNGVLVTTEAGWNDDSQLELALQFISEGGDYLLTKWHEFLQERASEESQATVDPFAAEDAGETAPDDT